MKTVAVVGQDARVQAAGRQLAAMGFVLLDVPQLYRADYLLLPMPLEGDKEGLTNLLRAAKPGAVAFAGRVSPAAQAAARASPSSTRAMPKAWPLLMDSTASAVSSGAAWSASCGPME